MTKRVCFGLFLGAMAILCVAAWTPAQQSQISPDVYNEMKFRYIGPVGNRATAVAGIPGNPNIYYVGAASGGIFKSTDARSEEHTSELQSRRDLVCRLLLEKKKKKKEKRTI